MGRPKKDIDEKRVAELAYEGCSSREIADILGLSNKTVENRFSSLLRKKRAERRHDLREAQTQAAKSGNAALLIWLGKNELDQSDKIEPNITQVTVKYVDRRIDSGTAETASEPGEDS